MWRKRALRIPITNQTASSLTPAGMAHLAFFTLAHFFCFLAMVAGSPIHGGLFTRDGEGDIAYKDLREGGGSMLDKSAGLGEPLNVCFYDARLF